MAATTIVETLMRIAATAGGMAMPGPRERAGGDGDGDDVVPGGPPQVLEALAVGGLRQPDDADDQPRVGAGEDEPGRLDGDVGAGADGDADVGAGEGGGVVDAVADHGDLEAAGLELGDLGGLVLGEDLGEHLVDAEVARRRRRRPGGRRR